MLISTLRRVNGERPAFGFTSGGLALVTVTVTAALSFSVLGLFGLREGDAARGIQERGQPVAACLLAFLRDIEPILDKTPAAKRPLAEYELLQSARFSGITCPDRKEKQ
jgi:hypothetical protein